MSRLVRTGILFAAVTVAAPFALSRMTSARPATTDIYVDGAAPPGGDGATPATAYQTIRDAVTDANASPADAPTIHVAAGTYIEAPNITITKDGVRLLGSTHHVLDGRGLPTGDVTTPAIVRPAVATAPAGVALLRIHASNVEVAGLVFDGGFPRPPAGPTGQGVPLLRADGAAVHRALAGLHIHGNSFQNTTQALFFRLSRATISGNFLARNTNGLAFYAATAGGAPGPHALFEGNRVVDHVNGGTTFLGFVGSLLPPTFASLGLLPTPGVNEVLILNNDYAGNADARTPVNGIFYPQALQYSALLFATAGSDNSDPLQPGSLAATIAGNTFSRNGYGIGINQRVLLTSPQSAQVLEMQLSGNRYCGNAFKPLMIDFGLIAQSHGTTGPGQQFRYAQATTYSVDGVGDGLTEEDFDLDHPEMDPRLNTGQLLDNLLLFNSAPIANGVRLTRPPVVSVGPPVVYGQPVTGLDHTPPEITSAAATPSALWPPDGKMVPVNLTASAVDNCDPPPVCQVASVSSSEAPSPELDWIFTSPLSLQLRARRAAIDGADRTYTLTVACTDAAGNQATAQVPVRVPHDRRR